jgi:hypothetical protein
LFKNSSTALFQNPYRHLLRYRGTENLLSLGLHSAQYIIEERQVGQKRKDTERKQEGRKTERKTGNQEDRKLGRQEIRETGN